MSVYQSRCTDLGVVVDFGRCRYHRHRLSLVEDLEHGKSSPAFTCHALGIANHGGVVSVIQA
jgi:hypothetical protein